ncbi:hypothetical protein HZP85_13880 [Elizabethkingia anophelis]|nr:hypothetical protein [Elizabethkingia anophelis]
MMSNIQRNEKMAGVFLMLFFILVKLQEIYPEFTEKLIVIFIPDLGV